MADFIVSDSGAEYTSIAAAYQAAAAQARATGQSQNVVVKFGEYDEDLTMDTDGVNLIAFNASTGVQPIINGTVTFNLGPVAYVTSQKVASIISFKIQKVRFLGSNYQNLQLSGCDVGSIADPAVVLNNTGSVSQPRALLSTLTATNSILASLSSSPAVQVTNGYFKGTKVTINGLFSGQSMFVNATTGTNALVGIGVSDAQIVGQIRMEYVSTPTYTTLNLSKSQVTVSGSSFSPIYVSNGKAKLSSVILSNPEARYMVYSTPTSVVAYNNISVPANSAAPPSPDIPRYRIGPDTTGAVVLNDSKGRLVSVAGTHDGQVLRWNQTKSKWEASNSTTSLSFETNDVAFGSAGTLNFKSSMAVSGAVNSGTATVELQLASPPVLVTTTPYQMDLSYRAFYFDSPSEVTINLPSASELDQQFVFFKNLTSNAVTIVPDGGDLIDGQSSFQIKNQYDGTLLQSVTFDGETWNWYKVSAGSTSTNVPTKFSLTLAEPVEIGDLVAVTQAGEGVLADSTIVGRFPAVGVCVDLKNGEASIQPVGPAPVFTGLSSGVTYFLGKNGKLSSTMPSEAIVAHMVAVGISATQALLTAGNTPIYR